MEHYNFIHDEEMITNFSYLLFRDLKPHEGIFVSLAARNKYLSPEDREKFQLGRSEMFNRQIVTNPDHLTHRLKAMSIYPQYSKKGAILPIEPNLLTAYININPIDLISAFHNASQVFYDRLLKKETEFNTYGMFKTEAQKTRSRKNFVDLDLDIAFVPIEERDYIFNLILSDLQKVATVLLIRTRSGAHFLLSNIKGNYQEEMKKAEFIFHKGKLLKDYEGFEFIHNKNAMVPIPGTMQGDYLVCL